MTVATGNSRGEPDILGDTFAMRSALSRAHHSLTRHPRTARATALVGRLGFGRAGALAAARRRFPARAATPARRTASLFVGSLFIGVGVTLLKRADLGLTPYDVLVSGLQPRLGLSFGQTVWVVAAVLFAIAALLRQFPSRWGIAYTFANGVWIDAVSGYINTPDTLFPRVLFVALALVSLSSGIALVVHSGSTGGAFELIMRAAELRGINRTRVRTGLEVSVFTLGVVLGGRFGPATIAVALLIGPMLGMTSQALADHSRGRVLRQLETSPERRHPSAMAR